jgi:hypothetical protein
LAYPLVEFSGSSDVASRNRSQRIQATNAASAVSEHPRTPFSRTSQNSVNTKFAEFTFHALG